MNSLDRVLAALNLEEPDRVPIGETGYDLGSISSILGISVDEGTTDRRRTIEKRIKILSRFIEALDLDIIPVSPSPLKADLKSNGSMKRHGSMNGERNIDIRMELTGM